MPFRCESGAMVAGRYRLERLLGEGGVGVVWAAAHTVTRKHVALKFLRDASDTSRHRFLREARAAGVLHHPNLVQIHDVLEMEDGAPVMVMELLDGETLADRLQRKKRFTIEELAPILLRVISAVGCGHAAGVIHRDLKPHNIFLVGDLPNDDVRVLDFGIAKLTAVQGDAQETAHLTRTGELVGTPFYMSPEQVFGEHDIDHRADVWALGVILYECLSGSRPFAGENVGQILKHIVMRDFKPLEEVAPDVPPDVRALVGRMLANQASERPADLREVHEVIARYAPETLSPGFGTPMPPLRRSDIEQQQTTDPFCKTEAASTGSAHTTMRTRRRKGPIYAAVALAAVVAGAAIAVPLWPKKTQMATRSTQVATPNVTPAAAPPVPTPAPPPTTTVASPTPAANPTASAAPPTAKTQKPAKKKKATAAAGAKPATLPGGVPEQVPF